MISDHDTLATLFLIGLMLAFAFLDTPTTRPPNTRLKRRINRAL